MTASAKIAGDGLDFPVSVKKGVMLLECSACGMRLEEWKHCILHTYEHMEIEFSIMDSDLSDEVNTDIPIIFSPVEKEE